MALFIFSVSDLFIMLTFSQHVQHGYLVFSFFLFCLKWKLFSVQHTSASLTINENYDSDVQADTETFLNRIVPEVIILIFDASGTSRLL